VKKTQIRPVYTMDIMRLVQINELVKISDMFYIQLEAGTRDRIIPLRATLKTLFSKIRRFCKDKYPEETEKISESFETLDETFDFFRIEDNNEDKFNKAKKILVLLKELIDEIIDEIWVKSYEILTEEERAKLYNLGRA